MNFKKYINAYKDEFEKELVWNVAIRKRGSHEKFHVIELPSKAYWMADPFLFEYEGENYLFFERFDRKRKKGELAYSPIYDDLHIGPEKVIISRPYHLSFPNIFSYNGEIYIIPESSENKTLEIYKAIEFPNKWELYRVIMADIAAVDTIIYDKQIDRIVLLTSIGTNCCIVENRLIKLDCEFLVVDSQLNKAESDFGNRNGGALFFRNDTTYRVGQDCKNGQYGTGLVLYKLCGCRNEAQVAYYGAHDFQIDKLLPYCKVHTYNRNFEYETIDLGYYVENGIWEKWNVLRRLATRYVKRRLHN